MALAINGVADETKGAMVRIFGEIQYKGCIAGIEVGHFGGEIM